jgi:putative FmdB family regulatory protein
MPIYEYQCKACGRECEYQQRMSDPEMTTCEACGEDKLERIISRTAFSLKGSGWYKDLYASAKPEAAKSDGAPAGDAKPADGKPESKPEGKPEGKSESKPETKPETKKESKSDGGGSPAPSGGSSTPPSSSGGT